MAQSACLNDQNQVSQSRGHVARSRLSECFSDSPFLPLNSILDRDVERTKVHWIRAGDHQKFGYRDFVSGEACLDQWAFTTVKAELDPAIWTTNLRPLESEEVVRAFAERVFSAFANAHRIAYRQRGATVTIWSLFTDLDYDEVGEVSEYQVDMILSHRNLEFDCYILPDSVFISEEFRILSRHDL